MKPCSSPSPQSYPVFNLKPITRHVLAYPTKPFLRLTHILIHNHVRRCKLPAKRSPGTGNTPNMYEHRNSSGLNTRALEVSSGADVPVPPDSPPAACGYHRTLSGTWETGPLLPLPPHPGGCPGGQEGGRRPGFPVHTRGQCGEGGQELVREMVQC